MCDQKLFTQLTVAIVLKCTRLVSLIPQPHLSIVISSRIRSMVFIVADNLHHITAQCSQININTEQNNF